MNDRLVDAVFLGGAAAHDLSPWGLFLQADIVVKIVMLMLVVASVWCWAIIFEKVRRLRRLNAAADRFEQTFWSGDALDSLYERVGTRPQEPMSAIFASAMREWRRSMAPGHPRRDGMPRRIERAMQVTLGREMVPVERYLTFLASVGSTAPFLGLFGTVWGIMNSFVAIAGAQTTNLAVVAPGIAEALFATALGLLAAIPAVVAYNKISSDLNKYAGRLEAFANEFAAILSRELEEEKAEA